MILTSPVASVTFFAIDSFAPGKPVFGQIKQVGRTIVVPITTPIEDAEGGDLSGLSGVKVALLDYSVDVQSITFDNLSDKAIQVQTSTVFEPGVDLEYVFTAPQLSKNYKIVAFAFQDTSEEEVSVTPEPFIEDAQ